MIGRNKRKLFREALSNVQQRCGQVIRDSFSELSDEVRKFGVEADANNYVNPEVGFLRLHAQQWDVLAVQIPAEIERGMISIITPLSDSNKNEVRKVLIQYFERFKDDYLRSWQMRKAAKGKGNEQPESSFLALIDSKLNGARANAENRLDQAFKARKLDYKVTQRRNVFNVVIGFLLGIVASYLASVLWNMGSNH